VSIPRRHPRFSVIIPAFNSAGTLNETLSSVINQSLADWEAIVIDDGSTDDTYSVASDYAAADERIRVVRQDNAGSAMARNAAVALAHGEWLCLLDADDLYCPEYLASQDAFIVQHPGYDIYSCNAEALSPDGCRVPFNRTRRHERPTSFTLIDMLEPSPINVFSVVRKSVFDRIGGFRPGVYVEDYDFWLRALAGGARHIHNPQSLVTYRVSPTQKSANTTVAMHSVIESLDHLVEVSSLERGIENRIRSSNQRNKDTLGRWELESSLRAGDFNGALRRYWLYRRAWVSKPKWIVGLAAMALSPRLYCRLAFRHDGKSVGGERV
jgi:glycosyltransferase involved in cell wall biosynthesis